MPTHPITITPAPAAFRVSDTLRSLSDQLTAGRITSSDAIAAAQRALLTPAVMIAAAVTAHVQPRKPLASIDETIAALEALNAEMDAWLASI